MARTPKRAAAHAASDARTRTAVRDGARRSARAHAESAHASPGEAKTQRRRHESLPDEGPRGSVRRGARASRRRPKRCDGDARAANSVQARALCSRPMAPPRPHHRRGRARAPGAHLEKRGTPSKKTRRASRSRRRKARALACVGARRGAPQAGALGDRASSRAGSGTRRSVDPRRARELRGANQGYCRKISTFVRMTSSCGRSRVVGTFAILFATS